jgi:hypothetical protein
MVLDNGNVELDLNFKNLKNLGSNMTLTTLRQSFASLRIYLLIYKMGIIITLKGFIRIRGNRDSKMATRGRKQKESLL